MLFSNVETYKAVTSNYRINRNKVGRQGKGKDVEYGKMNREKAIRTMELPSIVLSGERESSCFESSVRIVSVWPRTSHAGISGVCGLRWWIQIRNRELA